MALFLERNFRTDDLIEDAIWKKIREHEYIEEYLTDNIDISLMVAAYAFKKAKHDRKQLSKINTNGGWLQSLSKSQKNKVKNEERIDNAITLMLAIAVEDRGDLDILKESTNDIQSISEEYANAGAEEFYNLILKSEAAEIFYKELFVLITA